ncbi:hypothetical protein DPMN_111265 [Dreissena polymorpha]|uniref:Uncharacterized protein n=1 Tax=Dreissena polymorpha TaxID=45954 RepID=A0A9D4KDK7_DREPO|nr:hypothetical protein DPMN_111265 [Dreissena polymorpha]
MKRQKPYLRTTGVANSDFMQRKKTIFIKKPKISTHVPLEQDRKNNFSMHSDNDVSISEELPLDVIIPHSIRICEKKYWRYGELDRTVNGTSRPFCLIALFTALPNALMTSECRTEFQRYIVSCC